MKCIYLTAALLTGPFKTKDRRLFLGMDESWPLNMIRKTGIAPSAYFQHSYLQFLMADDVARFVGTRIIHSGDHET